MRQEILFFIWFWYFSLIVAPVFLPAVLLKKVSEKFWKFHRKKHLLKYLFNRVACLKICNFLKKRLQHRYFPMEFTKYLRKPILKNICEQLLLEPLFHLDLFGNLRFWLRLVPAASFVNFSFTTFGTAIIRSSCPLMFFKKGVLRKFAKLTRKHYSFFNEDTDLHEFNFIKKEIPAEMFSWKFLVTSLLKNPSDGCFCINTRSVYCHNTILNLFEKDITQIFCLSIFSAQFVDWEQEWAQYFKSLARSQKPIFNLVYYLQWKLFSKIVNS